MQTSQLNFKINSICEFDRTFPGWVECVHHGEMKHNVWYTTINLLLQTIFDAIRMKPKLEFMKNVEILKKILNLIRANGN